jgi:hypothetical protein
MNDLHYIYQKFLMERTFEMTSRIHFAMNSARLPDHGRPAHERYVPRIPRLINNGADVGNGCQFVSCL